MKKVNNFEIPVIVLVFILGDSIWLFESHVSMNCPSINNPSLQISRMKITCRDYRGWPNDFMNK